MPQIPQQHRSAFLKSERARKQLRDLQSAIHRYREHKPYGMTAAVEQQRGESDYVFRFQVNRPIPDSFVLIIGDIVHNLRSALDHAIWALYVARWPSYNGTNLYFPITDTKAAFDAATKRHIKAVGKRRGAIIGDIQPYETGSDALTALHAIDIVEKHRAINILGATASPTSLRVKYGRAGLVLGPGEQMPISVIPAERRIVDGAEAYRLPLKRLGPNPQVEVSSEWDVQFVFVGP